MMSEASKNLIKVLAFVIALAVMIAGWSALDSKKQAEADTGLEVMLKKPDGEIIQFHADQIIQSGNLLVTIYASDGMTWNVAPENVLLWRDK